MKRINITIIGVCVSILFTGCAMTPQKLTRDYKFDKSKETSLVFGKTIFYLPLGGQTSVRFKNIKTKKRYSISAQDSAFRGFKRNKNWDNQVKKDFFIELPPGDYRINLLRILGGDMTVSDVHPEIDFSIPPSSVVYIGTLAYSFTQEHDYLWVKTGTGHTAILDERHKAIEKLRKKYPNIKEDIVVNLMELPE